MARLRVLACVGVGLALLGAPGARAGDAKAQIEEVIVTGERPKTTTTSGPRSYVEMADIDAINVTTVEDVIAYEPSVIVRRRFIGDPNGTLGIRGSNQFQTTHAMVFADGVPLHYLLETSFNGAPRWSLVAPDEIVGTEVLYGPFSAEYSGNSMGGVVNFETELPAERRFHLESSGFVQNYNPNRFGALGDQEDFGGRRVQGSYGDRFGKLSVYLSHNHLNNESQPLTNRAIASFSTLPSPSAVPVSGAQLAPDAMGNDVIYFSDTGPEEVTTNLTKLKLGYSVSDDWLARLTVAYENRKREVESPENFLRDAAGNPVFGNDLLFEGRVFSVPSNQFEVAFQDRDTLLVGAGLDGELGNGWKLEVDFSRFDIVKDENRRSNGDFGMRAVGGAQPFSGAGRLTRFKDTGWITGDLKLRTSDFLGRDDMRLVTGVHYEDYELEIEDFNASNFRTTEGRSLRSRSGGETHTRAAFVQWGWQLTDRWDLELGGRYERWKSTDGFFVNGSSTADPRQEERRESAFSPKASLGYTPDDIWSFRYSIARATRFPVVAELFLNVNSFTSANVANPGLDPEEGLHHNFMIERKLANGYVRANLYREVIGDVIFNQRSSIDGTPNNSISTFLPIDEEVVNGAEMILSLRGLVNGKIDLQANLEYTRAKIRKNDLNKGKLDNMGRPLNVDDFEGNDFPRLPRWRGNLLLTYSWTARFKTSAGFRYASDSFDTLENADREDDVFGAQDAYRFLTLKATYELSESSRIGFGIDNVTNEEAYVFHPWPARTLYAEFAVDF